VETRGGRGLYEDELPGRGPGKYKKRRPEKKTKKGLHPFGLLPGPAREHLRKQGKKKGLRGAFPASETMDPHGPAWTRGEIRWGPGKGGDVGKLGYKTGQNRKKGRPTRRRGKDLQAKLFYLPSPQKNKENLRVGNPKPTARLPNYLARKTKNQQCQETSGDAKPDWPKGPEAQPSREDWAPGTSGAEKLPRQGPGLFLPLACRPTNHIAPSFTREFPLKP